MGAPPFDASFLSQGKAEAYANAWPVAEDGEYLMNCNESDIVDKKDKTGKNWKIFWVFPPGSEEAQQYGKMKFRQYIELSQQNMPRIMAAFEALYDVPWPEGGLTQSDFAAMVQAAAGRNALVTIEVVPHWQAEQDEKFADAKQNSVVAVRSPVMVEEEEEGFFNVNA